MNKLRFNNICILAAAFILFSLVLLCGGTARSHAMPAPHAFSVTSPSEETVSEQCAVVQAIDLDRSDLVLKWIRAGHSPFARINNKMKEHLLDRAANEAHPKVFETLLREIAHAQTDAHVVDSRGTPLIISLTSLALPNQPKTKIYETMIESLLLFLPRSIHDKDKAYIGDGRTALHQAAAIGNVKLMHLFVSRRADVNAKNSSGETPLHLAARFGHLEVVRDLVLAHAKVNEKTFFTQATPIMSAAETGQKDIIRFLMRSGANKDLRDAFGKTAPERYKEYASNSSDRIAPTSKKQ